MASFLPVTLVGDNLGQRHRHLNSLVQEAKKTEALFEDVEALPEESAVDRLFKIDLAIELKHVDYVVRNLKDDDMLYVSRALKATWLIDHRDIINPKYLEDVLFPEMITPAVTKMKHWLYINLRDPAMCQEFYQHYKENTFEFAIKFLSHCSHEFILKEAPKILTKLSTHSLKVLCEKCPKVAKIYFDSLATDKDLKTRYLGQDRSYFNSVKCVLKSDADVFLDITEKYFNMNSFSRFSPLATDYILRCTKTRFRNKLELYVAYFLHIPTLAARLSVDECQEVVLKLARASYLKHWFEYKVVEPLIKRVSPDKRAAFKKRVFVEKDVGECIDKWPYEIPVPPVPSDTGPHIFDDQDFMTSPMYPARAPGGCALFGAAASLCAVQHQSLNHLNVNFNMIRVKTDLDRLFDEFRFIGFERALHELGQRLVATASPDRRRDIFIVLVSKTGGRTDAVSALLRLAVRHINEPPHTRAAILRSLVKRAKVWRLPQDIWQHLLDYGHGLGLDGTQAEAACREGLHAVVIRQLLAGAVLEQAVRDAFMNDFSTLVEYSLKVDERTRVANGLQNMLAAAATDVASELAADRLWRLLDVLKIYRVRVEPTSPAVKAVIALALRDADVARPLLERLYHDKIARRELLRLNMEFRRDEAALLNALRHDPSLLNPTQVADTMPHWNCWQRNFRSFKPHPIPFGSVDAKPKNFGTSAVTTTGFRFDSSTLAPTDVSSSAAPLTGFRFGSFTSPPTDVSSSAALPTGFRFDSSTLVPTDVSSSAAPQTGFRFDSSTSAPTDASSSAAPPTVFRFDGSTLAPTDVSSSAAPLTGFRFDGSTSAPIDVSNSAAPPTGFHFDGSTSAPTDVSSSVAPPTGFRFGSSTSAPTDVSSSAAPPTGFHFDSSTSAPIDVSSSVAPPTGFHFDGSTSAPTDVSSSAAPPTGFRFGSSATAVTNIITAESPTDVDSSSSPPTGFSFGNSATVTDNFSVAPIDFRVGDAAAQSTDVGSSVTLPSGLRIGSSADQTTVDSISAVRPIGFSTSTDQPFVFGTSTAHSTVTGSGQPTLYGSSTARPMHFGMPAPQMMGFRRNPYHRTRFRMLGARQANFDSFISKLVIYFNQKQDFTTDLCTALKNKLAQVQNVKLARPLASLFGNNFEKELHAFDAAGKESVWIAAALRACAHRARPVVNLAEWSWRKAGVKAVATRAMRCREIERAALTRALAAERRTVRVALALSMRSASGLFMETFASTAKLRPMVALHTALPYFRRHGVSSDLRVWDIVKPLISSDNLGSRERLRHLLGKTEWIPSTIKADYCITLYCALYKISFRNAQMILPDLSKLLPECDESIETILLQMLNNDDNDEHVIALTYPTIFIRYLLLSKNEEDVERRFMTIGNQFLERLDALRSENDYYFQRRLTEILESLMYNSAFLDAKYTSCLSVIERILAWTQKFMPTEEYFEKYVHIHLTILYIKAIRQSMNQMPEVFADPKRRKSEGVEAVGFVFGRYIAKEVAELVSTYFDSIIELYTDGLVKYLSSNLMYGSSRNIFIGFVLKGILTEAVGVQRRLAVYVLREHQIVVEEFARKEIEELIMKDRVLEFFAHAELFSSVVPVVPFYNRF